MPRRTQALWTLVLGGLTVLWAHACRGWDDYDPRLGGETSTGAGMAGGAGDGGGTAAGGGSGGSGVSGGGSGGAAGGTGGTGGTPLCGTVAVLNDDFEDGTLPATWGLQTESGSAIAEIGGALVLTTSGTDWHGAYAHTEHTYQLTAHMLSVEVLEAPLVGADVHWWFNAMADHDNYIEFYFNDGSLHFGQEHDDAWQNLASMPFDLAAHRFLRFREEAGTVHWEYSADGSVWTLGAQAPSAAAFDLDNAHVSFGLESPQASTLRVDNLNGGGPPTASLCAAHDFTDDFDDNSRSSFWEVDQLDAGCFIAEAGGELSLNLQAGQDAFCTWRGARAYDLQDSAVHLEVTQAPGAGSEGQLWFAIGDAAEQNAAIWNLDQGQFYLIRVADSSWADIGSFTFDPVQHRFLRLRESSLTIYWETSPDGQSFTERGSAPVPMDPSLVEISVGVSNIGIPATDVEIRVDNLNLVP